MNGPSTKRWFSYSQPGPATEAGGSSTFVLHTAEAFSWPSGCWGVSSSMRLPKWRAASRVIMFSSQAAGFDVSQLAAFDQRGEDRPMLRAVIASRKERAFAVQRDRSHRPFSRVCVQFALAVLENEDLVPYVRISRMALAITEPACTLRWWPSRKSRSSSNTGCTGCGSTVPISKNLRLVDAARVYIPSRQLKARRVTSIVATVAGNKLLVKVPR